MYVLDEELSVKMTTFPANNSTLRPRYHNVVTTLLFNVDTT